MLANSAWGESCAPIHDLAKFNALFRGKTVKYEQCRWEMGPHGHHHKNDKYDTTGNIHKEGCIDVSVDFLSRVGMGWIRGRADAVISA